MMFILYLDSWGQWNKSPLTTSVTTLSLRVHVNCTKQHPQISLANRAQSENVKAWINLIQLCLFANKEATHVKVKLPGSQRNLMAPLG